jgi:hypothetical protein
MARKKGKSKKKDKIISFLKNNWQKAAFSLVGAIATLILAKACNVIWPDTPVVVKEHTDTVKVIHSMDPLQVDSDSIIRKQLEQQLMNIELLNKYEEKVIGRREAAMANACKIIVNNPYPNSRGYSMKSASSFCFIEMLPNGPFIDINYSFFREDYVDLINTLCVKISKKDNVDGKDWIISDMNYEPQKGKNSLLVRIVNDLPSGDYLIEAGFVLKDDRSEKYPSFYRQSFPLKK